jgi:hypothetical protein
MNAQCVGCGAVHDVGARVGFKLGLVSPAVLVGATVARKNPWLAVGMAVIGLLIGHYADQHILPTCPRCGTALQLLDAVT